MADLTQGLSSLIGAGIEIALSGIGTVTTTCGTPEIPTEFQYINVTKKPLKPIIWSPFENPGDRCYQAVAIGDVFYMLRLSLEHPLREAGNFLMDIPLHGYVIHSTVGGSPEFFPRTTSFHSLAVKEDGEIGLHLGHKVLKFETLEHREAYALGLSSDSVWSPEVLKTKRRLSVAAGCSPTTSPTLSVPFVELGLNRKMCAVKYILTDGLPIKDSSGAEITDAAIQNQMTKISQFYIQNSYNKFTFTTPASIFTVRGSVAPGDVNYNKMLQDWRIANPGVWCTCDAEYIIFNYGMGGYNVPGWAGLATLNTQGGWLNGDITPRVWAHEIGHNVGFGHSRQYQLTNPAPTWMGTGIVYEYGDPYDLMGGGTVDMTDNTFAENDVAYFGTLYRALIQNTPWIPASSVTQIGETINNGALDVILYPCDLGTSTPNLGDAKLAVQYLRPADISQSMTTAGTVGGGTSTETIKFGRFFFEYKTKLKTIQARQGLIVHGAATSGTSFGIMLDNNPSTTSTSDSPLSFGNTFSDCTYGVHVTGERMDCPGASAGSMGCARAMLRNGKGGVNIVLTVTDASTGMSSSSTTVGGSVTLNTALSGYNTALKPTSVYFDWGDGTIDKGSSGTHSWTTSGVKVVTVTATTLESAYTKVLYKVVVGTGLNIAKLITSDTVIDADSQGKTFSSLMIDSSKSGFTVTMMVKFTNTGQTQHEMWQLGSWTFLSSLTSGNSYGFYFIQGQGSASGGPAPYFNKVAQAAIIVEKTGTTATATVYIDGAVYYTGKGIATAWPTTTTSVKVGSWGNNNRFLGGTVSKFTVYNWALSSADLALDAAGADLLNLAQAPGGSTSGCTAAAPTSPAAAPTAPTVGTLAPTALPTTPRPTTSAPTPLPTLAPTFAGCALPASFPAGYVSGGTSPCTAGARLLHQGTCTIACAAGLTAGNTSPQYSCNNGVLTNPTLTCVGSAPSQVLITTPTATGFTVSAAAASGILRVNIDTNSAAATLTTVSSFWAATTNTKQATATGSAQTFDFTGLTTGTRYCAAAAASPNGQAGSSSAIVTSVPTCVVVGNRCTLPTGSQPGWDQTACPLGSIVDNTFTCAVTCAAPYTARTGTTQYICNNGILTQPSLVCNTNAPTPLPTTSKPTAPPIAAATPTCYDGVQNGNEVGVDCGGPDCGPCACGVVVVEEATPSVTPRAFFGTYINTGTMVNSRPVYQHITSKQYLYSYFASPDTYWMIGLTTNGVNFDAYAPSVASTAQSIPPGAWIVGSSLTTGTALPQLSSRCQTFNGTSECKEVRIDGRIGSGSYVNGIWINQNNPYGGHPTYKHSSLPRYLYWSSNAWNIADAIASASVIAKRPSHALNTYIPFLQGYSFNQPWQFLSGATFAPDSAVTSWCLGCIGVSVNNVQLLAQATYYGNHEMYTAVGQPNMLVFTHGGWAYVPTSFNGYALSTAFSRAPAAFSPSEITRAFDPALTQSAFCSVPGATPTPSDACFSLSCQSCIANNACKFCATGSNVGSQRCLSTNIECSGTTTVAANCPNVDDIPRSCGPLVSPRDAVPATCNGTLGQTCTFACAVGFSASGSLVRTCATGPATWDGTALTCIPKACPTVTSPTGGTTVSGACTGKVEGNTCSFACNSGYVGTGAYSITCRNGAWVGTTLTCAKIACPTISSSTNAVANTCTGKVHGDSCVFFCNAGYTPANSTLRCDAGTWVGDVAQCSATPCPILGSPFGANVATCGAKVSGDVCTFACKAGFVAAGSASRTCTNGDWSGTPLSCTAPNTCPALNPPFPGSGSSPCTGIAAGGTCTLTCQPGYTQGGDSVRTCGPSFTWSGSPLTCTPKSCPTLNNPPGAVVASCSGKVQGETCTFVCAAGYQSANNQGTRTCDNQAWGGSPLVCNLKVCPDLNPPPNAVQTACTQTLDKGTCSWVCNPGYAPKDYSIFCLDGAWANIPPLQCVQTTCPDLLPPVGGTGAACIGKTHLNTCTFGCSPGFAPNIYATRTCQDGVWSGQPFTCTNPTSCPALESPLGALPATCSGKQLGQSCSFTCAAGYVIASGDNTRLCGNGLVWSGNMLQCAPKACYDLPSPANAVPRTCTNITEGQTCLHQCDSESTPLGNAQRTCVNGAWDGVPLQCHLQVCPGLTAPINSTQFGSSCQGYGSRAVCTFKCMPGYITVGDPSRICLQGAWTGNVLQCVDPSTQYVWSGSSWGPCSATCGYATQTRSVDCVDLFNASNPVSPSICNNLGIHPADSIQDCANPACQAFNWVNGTWGQCTQACGGGQMQRTVQCQGTIGSGALATTSIVSDDMCNLAQKPPSVQSCNTDACAASTWSSTLWSSCSALCGGGTQIRSVSCLDSNLNVVPDSNCSRAGAKPESSRVCNQDLCLSFKWKVCPLDKCTAPCNGAGNGLGMIGYQYREIFCLRNTDQKRVDDSLCQATAKPTEFVEGCNGFPCSANYWMTTRWTPCNATGADGSGTRDRTYHCHFADGRNALLSDCPKDKVPTTVESCNINVCRGEAFSVAGPKEEAIISSETGMYIGIGVGVFFGVLLAAVLIWFIVKRCKNARSSTETTKQLESEMASDYIPKSYGKSSSPAPAPAAPMSRPSPPPAPPGRLPYGWAELQDGDGNTYYENSQTGETSWEVPS